MRSGAAGLIVVALAAFQIRCASPPLTTASAPVAESVHPTTVGSSDEGNARSHFGQNVSDPFAWLEASGPRVDKWVDQQGALAAQTIGRIPDIATFRAEIADLLLAGDTVSALSTVGNRVFYLRRRKGEESGALFVRDARNVERLLYRAPAAGQEIDNVVPSQDGQYVAFSLGNGTEDDVVQVVDVQSSHLLEDKIRHLNAPNIAWLNAKPGSKVRAFYYLKFPHFADGDEKSRYQDAATFLHTLGEAPSSDPRVLGTGVIGTPALDNISYPQIVTVHGSEFEVAKITHGTDDALELHARRAKAGVQEAWRKIVDRSDHVIAWALRNNLMYVLIAPEASGHHIGVFDLREPKAPRDFANITDGKIGSALLASSEGLYVVEGDVRGAALRRIDFETGRSEFVSLPFEGSIGALVGDPTSPVVFFEMEGPYQSERWLKVANARAQPIVALADVETRSFEAMTEHAEVVSRDGTSVPLTIMSKKNAVRNGASPTVLLGYGAYGFALDPIYSPSRLAWLERGGTLAIAHVRGGGEHGRAWHEAGMGGRRQNSIDDFISCAEYLIHSHYTKPSLLAASGESAGGLLIAMAAIQRPDLFRAIDVIDGMVNVLDLMGGTIGPGNAVEFGSPDTKAGFGALLAMDAYHQIHDGVPYPAALVTVGLKDARVPYWQGAKFVARLQAASTSGRPVLLDVDRTGGHVGGDVMQEANELAVRYAFFLWQMGLSSQPADGGRDGG